MTAIHTPVLASFTRDKLRNRPRSLSYQKIYEDTDLSVSWLTDFASNVERDFGCDKVETLYVYLTNSKLNVED